MNPLEAWRDPWKLEADGHAHLWSLHRTLRQEVKARWNRAVPFADELFDRWERAAFLGFGEGASIYDASLVLGDVQVGEQTWIGPFTVLDGRGGLIIGRYCSISAGVQLYSHDTLKWALTGGRAAEERQPTRIGDCCYIGPMSIVSKGVTVGEHCVIGAHSFVREAVPPFSIAVGSPARVVGRVELIGDADVRLIYEEKKS
jgi:acetyltransferase-like isoleucine patch superfamily enzyme